MSTTQPGTGHEKQNDAGAATHRRYALAPTSVGAGFGGSGTAITGTAINRCDPDVALAAIPAVPAHIVLASGHSVTFVRRVQDRDGSDAFADYGEAVDNVVVTANYDGSAIDVDLADPQQATLGAGGAISGGKWSCDLAGAKTEIRLKVTPTLSASGVDTVKLAGSIVLAGYDQVPPSGE